MSKRYRTSTASMTVTNLLDVTSFSFPENENLKEWKSLHTRLYKYPWLDNEIFCLRARKLSV